MLPFELAVNLILLVLLGLAVGGGYVLNRRLGIMRDGQQQMAQLIEQLNVATTNTKASVDGMRKVGEEANNTLAREIGRARALADELALITEAGDSLADRLEKRLSIVSTQIREIDGAAGGSPEDIPEVDEELVQALKQAR